MLLTQYCNQASWQTQKKHREQTCENFVFLFSIGAHLLNGLPDSSKLRDENHTHFLHNVFLPGITVVEKNTEKSHFVSVRFIIHIGTGFAGRPTLPIKGNFKRIKKVVTPGSQK